MSRFDDCLNYVLKAEGGYINDKADHGGATNCGVTQAVYDEWRIRNGKSRQPVMGIDSDEIKAIYFDQYWRPGQCGVMQAPLDYVHFDGCVNHGVGQANKFVQRALGVTADGVIGAQTVRALEEEAKAGNTDGIVRSVLEQRRIFYRTLAEKHPKQMKFLGGWLNRIQHVEDVTLK